MSRTRIWLFLAVLSCSLVAGFSPDDFSTPRDGFSVSDRVVVDDTAVFSTGYYSVDGSSWSDFSLQGDSIGSWVVGEARSSVVPQSARYFAVFSCSWDGSWSCSETWQVLDRGSQQTPGSFENSVQGDYNALMELYAVTDGDNWKNNAGWGDSPQSMGSWYGVETDSDGRVVRLNLEDNGLSNSVLRVDSSGNPLLDSEDAQRLDFIDGRAFPESVRNLQRLEYLNVRSNYLAGPLPDAFTKLPRLEYLLLSGRIDGGDPRRNSEVHPGKRRHIVRQNNWEGELPRDWSAMQRLLVVEVSHHASEAGLVGELPQSLFDLPRIGIISLYGNHFTGTIPEITRPEQSNISFISVQDASLHGPLPDSWGYLTAPYGKYFRFTGNEGLSGPIPQSYENLQDIRVIRFHSTNISGPFPAFLFHDGNQYMSYFTPPEHIPGPLPTTLPAQEADFGHISIFGFHRRGLTGLVPEWVARIRHVQFYMHSNALTELHELFYDSDAPVYQRIRNYDFSNNELSGSLMDVPFVRVAHRGVVSRVVSGSVVELGAEMGVVETGTISRGTSDWMHDSTKRGVWPAPWTNHEVQVHNPSGDDIFFTVERSTNYESGYLYSHERADLRGTEGWDYSIRPIVEDRVIRFKLSEGEWVARKIVSVNRASNQVTLDKPLDVDVAGLEYTIHQRTSTVWNVWLHGNSFSGPIPQSYGYIPSNREVRFRLYNNDLSGVVPDFSMVADGRDGSLDYIRYQNNRFTFRDILPHFAANDAAAAGHRYAPQRPFGPTPWGEQRVVEVSAGDSLVYDELSAYVSHPDNVYHWEKDGSALSGQDSVELRINSVSSSDAGLYRLRVDNPNLPDLTLSSEEIRVVVR